MSSHLILSIIHNFLKLNAPQQLSKDEHHKGMTLGAGQGWQVGGGSAGRVRGGRSGAGGLGS